MTKKAFKIAVIVARYGLDAIGGAETLARGFAEEAARRGWSPEVWTTCALDPFEWRNVLAAGTEMINGVTVRRFLASAGDRERYEELADQLCVQHCKANIPFEYKGIQFLVYFLSNLHH